MNKIKTILRLWLPFAVVTTAFCGLAYATVQQSQRHDADDPQIQMAEDAAAALNDGTALDAVVPKAQVEMSTSLAPFIVVYDNNGKPVVSSGLLNGAMPAYPMGALNAAKQSGENRVTWQPDADTRIASVVIPYNNGFVMAGRSLREVEKHESQTEMFAAATWIVTLIALFIVIALGEFLLSPENAKR